MINLTESIYVYRRFDNETVFIADPGNKRSYSSVKKNSETISEPEVLENKEFDFLIKNFEIFIYLDKPYRVGNIDTNSLFQQLSSATIVEGKTKGCLGFNPVFPDKTVLLLDNSDLKKKAEEDLEIIAANSLYKKTTKYQVGHRYDVDHKSLIYLGKFGLHLSDDSYYRSYKTAGKLYNFFAVNVEDNIKTVEEELLKGIYKFDLGEYFFKPTYNADSYDYNYIIITDKNKPMIDRGEVLTPTDDSFDISSILEKKIEMLDLIPASIESKYMKVSNLRRILPHLLFSSSGTIDPVKDENVIEKFTSFLKTELEYLYLKLNTGTVTLGENELNSHLLREFTYEGSYRELIVKAIEKKFPTINTTEMAKSVIKNLSNTNNSLDTFEDLIDRFFTLERSEPEKYELIVNLIMRKTTEDILPEGPFRDIIGEIYQEALDSYGSNLKTFTASNVGTKTFPLIKYTMVISLEDIKKHLKVDSVHDLPLGLKKDILKNKIYLVEIITQPTILFR